MTRPAQKETTQTCKHLLFPSGLPALTYISVYIRLQMFSGVPNFCLSPTSMSPPVRFQFPRLIFCPSQMLINANYAHQSPKQHKKHHLGAQECPASAHLASRKRNAPSHLSSARSVMLPFSFAVRSKCVAKAPSCVWHRETVLCEKECVVYRGIGSSTQRAT